MRRVSDKLRLLAITAGGIAAPFLLQSAQAQSTTCVDVQVGTAQSYTCLNQRLQAISKATAANAQLTQVPYDANSPGNVTGQFNESATRNRLGSNFGKSVTPERPAASTPHSP